MEVEIIASDEQCGSEILFYGIGTLDPGANTGLHVHDDIEIAWFMLEGDDLLRHGLIRGGRFRHRGMPPATRPAMSRPGELHLHVNRSDTEPAVILMAYVGISSTRALGRSMGRPSTAPNLARSQGISSLLSRVSHERSKWANRRSRRIVSQEGEAYMKRHTNGARRAGLGFDRRDGGPCGVQPKHRD